MPESVKVGPFRYQLVVGGPDWDVARIREKTTDLVGHCAHKSLVISTHPELVHDALCEVLVHEVLHACSNAIGQPLDTDDEEKAVAGLAPVLLGVLRENPALVAFLAS